MTNRDFTHDDQAGAETFDETHIDDEGQGDLLLDEAGSVLDLTHNPADDGLDPADDDVSGTYDPLDGTEVTSDHDPGGAAPPPAPGDIELVYMGLLDDVRGAQASAAHWEARTLSDDDIESLGYGPDAGADPAPTPTLEKGKVRS